MPTHATPIEPSSDREIVSTRLLDAPLDLVWAAHTDPQRVAHWWGPNGFTNTIHEMDARPGGKWRLTMRSPDGAEFHNESEFLEVVQPERIVFQHIEPVHSFRMTMLFAGQDGKTEITWRMLFASAAECDRVKRFIIVANEQNFDRLAAHLAQST